MDNWKEISLAGIDQDIKDLVYGYIQAQSFTHSPGEKDAESFFLNYFHQQPYWQDNPQFCGSFPIEDDPFHRAAAFAMVKGQGPNTIVFVHHIRQGLMGIFEVFMDTFVICTITCIVILVTGVWSSGLDGATLTLAAFETGVGSIGRIILAVGVFLFGLTTSSGVYAQIEVVVRYLIGDSPAKNKILTFYKWTYPIPSLALVFIAVYMGYPGTTIWLFSDASTALPILANIITLLILTPRFTGLIKDYKARYLGQGKIQEDFPIFYEKDQDEEVKARAEWLKMKR